MKGVILLGLKAIDFKDTKYSGIGYCAIEKAVLRQMNTNAVELVHCTIIDGKRYSHLSYPNIDFHKDKITASYLTDEEIVRVITLTKVQNV